MPQHATGRFDIDMKLETTPDDIIGRYSLTKRFHGDLSGTSIGHMLAVRTPVPGSAGYVLMEVVTAALGERSGSFVLQHNGTLDRHQPQLSVTVIPDSGTEGLTGLTGEMVIDAAADHRYDFSYSLPEAAEEQPPPP